MQLIGCPWCGAREEAEFHYGGQAHVAYPANPADSSDVDWAQYVFFRANPKGPFAERWMHTAGCRRWFNAVLVSQRPANRQVVRDHLPNPPHEMLPVAGHGRANPASLVWSVFSGVDHGGVGANKAKKLGDLFQGCARVQRRTRRGMMQPIGMDPAQPGAAAPRCTSGNREPAR